MVKIKLLKENLWLSFFGALVFILVWEVTARFSLINPIFTSSPSRVLTSIEELLVSKNFYPHLLISLSEIGFGLLLATIFGVIMGILLGRYQKAYSFLSFLTFGLYSTPKIALFPLIMIWFGLGIWAKIFLIFLSAFFPIFINTLSGVKNLNSEYLMLGKSLGATDFDMFTKITIPSSFPFIASGIKIAIPRTITGMVVAEFFAANVGLGYLINYYGATFQTSNLLAVVLLLILLSISLVGAANILEKKVQIAKMPIDK